ncbi:hypothetical protein [Pleionea sp. CnH1-48]|uniref:hypothetical protein n=1 Tax=Pleionea sp. CnH1-48 TaxID=2954494 RepID=UPI002096C193|nr:hypothetical protein [Pleionea sp. CnH1-48]MCO7225776.1 hypothetical protein [Pleionea sp. CnH1-48]
MLADRLGERDPYKLAEMPIDTLIYWMGYHNIEIKDNSAQGEEERAISLWEK